MTENSNLSERVLARLELEREKSYQHKLVWTGAVTRFRRLPARRRHLAAEGIDRYFKASDAIASPIDSAPINEIIADAENNRQV